MRFLEEKGIGYQTSAARVPLFLRRSSTTWVLGEGRIRPDKEMGYQACLNSHSGNIEEGSVGVGTGASVENFWEFARRRKEG